MSFVLNVLCDYHETSLFPDSSESSSINESFALSRCTTIQSFGFDKLSESCGDVVEAFIRRGWVVDREPNTGMPLRFYCPLHTILISSQ